ncbi:hypothetical protein [Leptolyngbya ohadii]|uniref:hypothetical protein n=1 Tax=Leptolyngbya ohadii TaxID=1962290 RepID=UPI0019D419BF|nr:hypothetical protein [Leptolyngbya ohadii]
MPVSEETITQAKSIRDGRDKQYRNIFREYTTDDRWVGEVGEICFKDWLAQSSSLPFEWITENAAGKADFVANGKAIGVKTVKRKVPMKPDYTAQITARHAEESVDYFFFCCYEFPRQQLWLLGGLDKDSFLKKARYYSEGESVHPNYQIRPGHEIYNIQVDHLTRPLKWLDQLRH